MPAQVGEVVALGEQPLGEDLLGGQDALAAAPGLALVVFNGKTAARALPRWRDAGLATLVLPSTSPAYTLPLVAKVDAWRAAVRA